MLFAALIVGFLAGIAAGGKVDNLLAVRLRWALVIFGAVALRLGTEAALSRGIAVADQLRVPLLGAAYLVLAVGLWVNRSRPGMTLALVGIGANAFAILVNGGYMPVWSASLIAAGFPADEPLSAIHKVLSAADVSFLTSAGPLGDIIPIGLAPLRNVLSIGDVLLAAGLAFFLFASLVRRPGELETLAERVRTGPLPARPVALGGVVADEASRTVRPGTGLAGGVLDAASAMDRPMMLGGSGAGIAVPSPTRAVVLRRPVGIRERALRHPYVRLALNGPFTALWTGQVVSLFGDRVHQIALAALVLGTTGSALAAGLVFAAAALPNLLFGPFAGVLVDRWNQKHVMIASDLIRAAIVLSIPASTAMNVTLVYPLVFVLTTVSIFFRPARTAVIPRLVREDELTAANSATWIGETLADVAGYPIAGLFVGVLGGAVAVAFWVDSATYVASAALIAVTAIPPVVRTLADAGKGIAGFRRDLVAGWTFLRHEPVLLANTLQAIVGQATIGVAITLVPVFARDVLRDSSLPWETTYAYMEAVLGMGNLIGGFFIGLLGARLAKGRMVIVGYVAYGLLVAGFAFAGNVAIAIGLSFGMGIANMVFVIPTQTLFQERTPNELLGRVVSFRFSAVFGAMTLAMAVGGILGEAFGAPLVLGAFGLLTAFAGLAGTASRPLRDA